MAAISVGTIQTFSDTISSQKVAGETIAVGDVVYKKSADSLLYVAVSTDSAKAQIVGIAITGAAINEDFTCVTAGGLDLGAVLAVGETYVLGLAGAIHPIGDRVSTWYSSDLGKASVADRLQIAINNTGILFA